VTVHGCAERSPLAGCQVNQGHATGSRDINYGSTLSGQTTYKYTDPWFYTYFKTIKFQDTW